MAIAKRCPFCFKKVDSKGRCQNPQCVDYKRTQIEEAEEKKQQQNSGK